LRHYNKYDDSTTALVQNGSYPYNLTASLAFTQNLLDAQLRTAKVGRCRLKPAEPLQVESALAS
jgi:hypothetical protein